MGKVPPDFKLYDVKKREEMNYIPPLGGMVKQLAFCPNRAILAVLTGDLFLLNVKNGAQLMVPTQGGSSYATFTFSPDGELFAAGDHVGNIYVWKTPVPDFN
jgi:hypothetical protein